VVRELDLREREALRQVVERQEVDEREVPERIDDRPPRVRIANGGGPRFVDLDVLEETLIEPREKRVRLVGDEGACAHGALLAKAGVIVKWSIGSTSERALHDR